MALISCPDCGRARRPGLSFCTNCGHVYGPPTPGTLKDESATKRGDARIRITEIVLIALIGAGIAGGIVILNGPPSPAAAQYGP